MAGFTGLSSVQAAERLRRDGPNIMPAKRPPSPLLMLIRQMIHFFAVMLWVAVGLALLAGLPQLSAAIAVIIVVNGVFAFVQEYHASRTAQHLIGLLPSRSIVIRDGTKHDVAAAELVVGDVVVLEAGDKVCADGRVLRADGLAANESLLTGESVPVPRGAGDPAFAGTFITEGDALVEITATGTATRLAGIASLSRERHRPPSPLAVRLHRVVRIVAFVALAVGLGFFGVAVALGIEVQQGFLLAIGVTVALVPEGLLPTVTLSLAYGARRMSQRNALVRSLEAVETLGSTTYLCTDKTGTLTRNEMTVVAVWLDGRELRPPPAGYDAAAALTDPDPQVAALALAGTLCSTGRAVHRNGEWQPMGDPMEAALHVLALRCGTEAQLCEEQPARRLAFDPRRRRMSVVVGDRVIVKGAVDSVLRRCSDVPADAEAVARHYSATGLRVLAVAERPARPQDATATAPDVESGLRLVGILALEDPPREGAAEAVSALRGAGIRVAMITGDHPLTARAIAEQVGLWLPGAAVVEAAELPAGDIELGEFLDRDGQVVARAAPEDKLRIAAALQARGHVVAMTGDGVNDGPALGQADIGVALGRGGTDVARETADLVLLDNHLATVVVAVETGRATFLNIRKFLTYHLTDNVAELAPFVAWALTGGSYPLALTVLQVLALDIGTDLLPAIALGTERANRRTLSGPMPTDKLIDRRLLTRVFGVLGPVEAVVEMAAFTAVLFAGGWVWGAVPDGHLLAVASGTAFAAVVLGQLANAFACRSATRWFGAVPLTGNPLLLIAVAVEAVLLVVFLAAPWFSDLLGGSWPSSVGWMLAMAAIPAVLIVDTLHKAVRARRSPRLSRGPAAEPPDGGRHDQHAADAAQLRGVGNGRRGPGTAPTSRSR